MSENFNDYNPEENNQDNLDEEFKKFQPSWKPKKDCDLIELVAYLYQTDSATIEDCMHELSKSRRTIYRMIERINIYDSISLTLDSDFKTVLHFRDTSERTLDHAYATTGKFAALYVFLKGLKKDMKSDIILISDIQKWLSCNEKAAIAVRNNIINTTAITDYEISDDDPYWE